MPTSKARWPVILALLTCTMGAAQASPLKEAKAALDCEDYARAVPILRAEAARGDAAAQWELGRLFMSGNGVPRDHRMAVKLWRQAEAAEDAKATADLRIALRDGTGVPKSKPESDALLPKAVSRAKACAEKGDPECMVRLGALLLDEGFRDPTQRIAWMEKYLARLTADAESGGAPAQTRLARQLAGFTAPLGDPAGARMWARRAADHGFAPAKYILAKLLIEGKGGPKDEAAGLKLHREAAEAGYAPSYFSLAGFDGKNPELPELYRKAAEFSSEAANSLAGAYENGWGVEKDPAESVRWEYRAAKSGNPAAQYYLAKAYFNGVGVPKDNAEAYKWYLLSSWQLSDSNAANSLPQVGPEMTPAERADGLKRAKSFEYTTYPLPKPMCDSARLTAEAVPVAVPRSEAPTAAPVRLPERPDDFALIVGIERYRGLPSADYAETDAAAMRDRLVGLGFPARNIVALLGADATRSKLHAYLDEWLPKNVGKNSRVFFYFSGHGSPDAKSGQAYLVPADGDPAFLKSTAYPLKDLYEALNALPARQIVAMLDSCFSGAGGRSVLAKGMRPLVAKVDMGAKAGPGRLVVLAAADGDQMTGGLEEQRRGAFTHFLLTGLEGAAQDPEGRITAGGLNAYLSPKVADAARRQNRDQTPMLYGDPAAVLFNLK